MRGRRSDGPTARLGCSTGSDGPCSRRDAGGRDTAPRRRPDRRARAARPRGRRDRRSRSGSRARATMVAMTADRNRQRTGLALRDALAWNDVVEVVRTAEETGYDALFLPEVGAREAFATLSALATRTSRIRLATGVVTTLDRRVSVTAMAAATVHDVSQGRMILGVGTGPSGPGALERLRRYVEDARAL